MDAKSGVSGAGRGAKQNLLYTEIAEGINCYGVTRHRHMPEIEQVGRGMLRVLDMARSHIWSTPRRHAEQSKALLDIARLQSHCWVNLISFLCLDCSSSE